MKRKPSRKKEVAKEAVLEELDEMCDHRVVAAEEANGRASFQAFA